MATSSSAIVADEWLKAIGSNKERSWPERETQSAWCLQVVPCQMTHAGHLAGHLRLQCGDLRLKSGIIKSRRRVCRPGRSRGEPNLGTFFYVWTILLRFIFPELPNTMEQAINRGSLE